MSPRLAVFRCSPLVRKVLLLLWVFELAAHAQTNAPIITTIAGGGPEKFLGEGGKATSANLNRPYGIAVDAAGNVYIADTGNYRIRKVSVAR